MVNSQARPRPRTPVWSQAGSGAQALAATRAAGTQDGAATDCGGTMTKTVTTSAHKIAGLKCALHAALLKLYPEKAGVLMFNDSPQGSVAAEPAKAGRIRLGAGKVKRGARYQR